MSHVSHISTRRLRLAASAILRCRRRPGARGLQRGRDGDALRNSFGRSRWSRSRRAPRRAASSSPARSRPAPRPGSASASPARSSSGWSMSATMSSRERFSRASTPPISISRSAMPKPRSARPARGSMSPRRRSAATRRCFAKGFIAQSVLDQRQLEFDQASAAVEFGDLDARSGAQPGRLFRAQGRCRRDRDGDPRRGRPGGRRRRSGRRRLPATATRKSRLPSPRTRSATSRSATRSRRASGRTTRSRSPAPFAKYRAAPTRRRAPSRCGSACRRTRESGSA